jgi:hypothetical protein
MLSGHNPASKPFQFPNLQLVDPTLPVPLVQVITQMLEMNEQARPASVAEVKEQLERVLRPESVAATQQASPEVPKNIAATQQASPEDPKNSAATSEPQVLPDTANAFAPEKARNQSSYFSSKRWRIARICLLALSLIFGLALGLPILTDSPNSFTGVFVLAAGVGTAVVGSILIFRKGRLLNTSTGGMLIALCGS